MTSMSIVKQARGSVDVSALYRELTDAKQRVLDAPNDIDAKRIYNNLNMRYRYYVRDGEKERQLRHQRGVAELRKTNEDAKQEYNQYMKVYMKTSRATARKKREEAKAKAKAVACVACVA